MSLKLRPEDRQAIDLLMDHTVSAKGNSPVRYAAGSIAHKPRIEKLQKLLHLLDVDPVSEPPRNLVARTLQRIDSAHHHVSHHRAPDLGHGASHPA